MLNSTGFLRFMRIEHKEILKALNKNHSREMKGRAGGAVMCICGQGCGGTAACGEMSVLIAYVENLEEKLEKLSNQNLTANFDLMVF